VNVSTVRHCAAAGTAARTRATVNTRRRRIGGF
jgi:hypothetical protein